MTELLTTTAADWDEVEATLSAHTSAAAYVLTELTAYLDSDLHHLVLDPETRTIWWAYDNAPLDGEGWTVEQLAPEKAAEQLDDHIDLIQDRMDDPEGYAYGGDPSSDQSALDEYTEILRLAIPAEPAEAADRIRRQRHLIARQDALWQRAYANLVRDLVGNQWGGKARAARALGVTDVQIARIIREDDDRRAALTDAAQAARD